MINQEKGEMRKQWGPRSVKWPRVPGQREARLPESENNIEHSLTAEEGQLHPLTCITHPFLMEMVICCQGKHYLLVWMESLGAGKGEQPVHVDSEIPMWLFEQVWINRMDFGVGLKRVVWWQEKLNEEPRDLNPGLVQSLIIIPRSSVSSSIKWRK